MSELRDLDHDIGLLDLLGAKDDETITGAAMRLVSDYTIARWELDCERQKLRDARAALRALRDKLEDAEFCQECAVASPAIEIIDRALATPAPVAVPATDSITVSPEQYQAIEDAISKPAAPTRALVDLMRGTTAKALEDANTTPSAAPDPVQSIQREGSITHADLMAIRERYGALYAAVFPIVPTLLCMFIERSSSLSDRKSAREAFTQLEARK